MTLLFRTGFSLDSMLSSRQPEFPVDDRTLKNQMVACPKRRFSSFMLWPEWRGNIS